MRAAIPFLAFIAGASALTNPLVKRDTSDVCANVDAELVIANPLTHTPVVFGVLDICLCLSGIPALLTGNVVVEAAVLLVGQAAAKAALTVLVNDASDCKKCTYPDHSTPACDKGSPCGWQCQEGFTPSPWGNPTSCVCEYPRQLCNGVCTTSTCTSSVPRKRSMDELKKRAVCDVGFTACGIFNGAIKGLRDSYECVDTASDLESCGGCSIPLHDSSPLGIDCTSLIGVSDVSCRAGSCVVHRCMPGYEIALDRSMCVDLEKFEKFVSASDYGLEHIPIGFH